MHRASFTVYINVSCIRLSYNGILDTPYSVSNNLLVDILVGILYIYMVGILYISLNIFMNILYIYYTYYTYQVYLVYYTVCTCRQNTKLSSIFYIFFSWLLLSIYLWKCDNLLRLQGLIWTCQSCLDYFSLLYRKSRVTQKMGKW